MPEQEGGSSQEEPMSEETPTEKDNAQKAADALAERVRNYNVDLTAEQKGRLVKHWREKGGPNPDPRKDRKK